MIGFRPAVALGIGALLAMIPAARSEDPPRDRGGWAYPPPQTSDTTATYH